MISSGNRGKEAEKLVKKALEKLDTRADTTFHRFPDAHAGSMVSSPCDFQAMSKGTLFMLEVKQTKQTDRLPKANFKADQRARLVKWQRAGSKSYVLVLHSETGLWRYGSVDDFPLLPDGIGSWKLDQLPVYESADAILALIFNMK